MHIHIYTYTFMYVCVYTYIYKYMYIYICIYIYIADIYLFVLYVLGVSVVTCMYVIRDNLQFKPWMPVDNLPAQWGPGWQTFNAFSV